MDVEEWFDKRRYDCDKFKNIKRLVKLKKKQKLKISICIPTLNEEANVEKVISTLKPLEKEKLIDEIIVVDSGSTDKTEKISKKAGAKFYTAEKYLKKHGKAKGKGENMWKSVYLAEGDIICWIDADIKNINPRWIYGLIGPLLTNKNIGFTKAFYQRPIKVGKELVSLGGGRVTELTIRPLFNMYFPRLSGFIQPLSGEYAMRRDIAEKIPFFTGYGVETASIIDIVKKFGLRRCAQVDIKRRIHRNQSLANLSKMAFGIMQVFAKRANTLGKLILVRDIKHKLRTINRDDEGNYSLKEIKIEEKQRPPMITLEEYRDKFKKEPKWLYA